MPSTWTDETGGDYLETVALLQEEIARLEAELRLRDEAAPAVASEPEATPAIEAAEARIGELTAQLAERDEMIGLLCEQLAALEEVRAARSAEWEQMSRWVQELEERIERGGTRPPDPDEGLREAEALRERLEAQQRSWGAERARLEQEISGLRSRLAQASDVASNDARATLESENHHLRDECRRLAAVEIEAAEAAALREQARALRAELDQAHRALDQARDDLRRERMEHEAELAALRTSLASAKASGQVEATPDERIRAIRLQLREAHEREERERAERKLSSRLSRLWQRTGSNW
ncbi:MAG: hypothetical protein IRY99_06845 [Isosphaeraceae bacterium]|nr:hypothetical protein [Isosphaeraceae bacterium]